MRMLLDAERLVLLLEHHADVNIKRRSISRELCIIRILHIAACPLRIIRGHIRSRIVRVEVLHTEETASEIHLSLEIAVTVDHLKAGNTGKTSHLRVIRTECRSDMNDTGTILCSHIITRNHSEGALARIEPRDELLIADAHQIRTLESAVKHLVRHELVARFVILEGNVCSLRIEMGVHKSLSHYIESRLTSIWVERKDTYIVDVRAYAEGCVRRKSPRRGCPGKNICRDSLAEEELRLLVTDNCELSHGSGILHVTVAARLVELVGAETCSRCRRIWLDGLSLVEKSLVIDLLEKIPEGLDITVVIRDVRIVHIDPVSHTLSHIHPLCSIFHHLLAAGVIIFLHRDLCSDIFLGDAQHLLHAKLHWKSVGIPSGTTVHLISALGLVAADSVLDGTGHHVVDSRHTVSRRRTLKENEFRCTFSQFKRLLERVVLSPSVQHLVACRHEIKTFIFVKFHK